MTSTRAGGGASSSTIVTVVLATAPIVAPPVAFDSVIVTVSSGSSIESSSTGRLTVFAAPSPGAHTERVLEECGLTAEEIAEFILVARSWVRQAVEADAVMELPLDEMRRRFGQWGQGAEAEDESHTRWPVGGSDFRETMYGLSWIPAGVDYTTDLAEPARGELRETLHRMLRALDAPAPTVRPESVRTTRQQA